MLNNINDNDLNYNSNLVMTINYYRALVMSEKIHRLLLEEIKKELHRMNIQDISNVQCLILYNIGDKKVTVGELTKGGYYLGSNVSYNLRKMVENGYLYQNPGRYDRRQSEISLTKKGHDFSEEIHNILYSHAEELKNKHNIQSKQLENIEKSLKSIEKFLNDKE